jgi:hypothetical protein
MPKSIHMCDNSKWDAIDAVNNDIIWIEKTKDEALPEQLKKQNTCGKESNIVIKCTASISI